MPRMPRFFRRLGGGSSAAPPQNDAIAKNSGGCLGCPPRALLWPNMTMALLLPRILAAAWG
eukprot:8992278-Alexandrium_andersonii.AAC.1